MTDDVKEALLVCFRNIAWSAQDYGDIIKDLEDAFNGNYDGFFNTWEWNLGDNIVKQSAGCDIDTNYKLDINYNANRRTLVTTKGRFPLNKHDGTGESIYYPIPVPRNANKAVITWAPSTQYANCTTLYYIGDGKYDRLRGSVFGWTTGGRLEVPLYQTDCIRVMCINIKYNQAGTSYPTEPSAFNVKFSIEE